MALFQKAPSTPDDMEASRPLEIEPGVVANMDEDEWYAKAYRGDSVPQLTVRAVVMGSILDDAATLAIVSSRSLRGTQPMWHAFCPASTALPFSTVRASSSPSSSSSGRRLFLRLHSWCAACC